MSLISKQIDELRAYAKDCNGELTKLISDAADTIEVLSAKLHASNMERSSQYYNDGWVSCSERLPHTYGIYIVTRRISDGFECRNITDACYFDGLNTWYDDTRVNFERKYLTDVLAWIKLPEPYKPKETKI